MEYTVYILECVNGSYYTGITTDLDRRYQEHQQGINCRYTRAFPPQQIAVAWQLSTGGKSLAQRIEARIKKQNKTIKTQLIQKPNKLVILLHDLLAEYPGAEIKYVIL